MKGLLIGIFRFFCTIWSGIVVVFFMVLFFPLMVFFVVIGKKERALHVPKYISHCCLFFMGIRLKVYGRDKIDDSLSMVYIFNHHSNLDPFITSVQTPGKAKLLAKAEILKYPVFGFALKHLHIPIKREDRRDRQRSLKVMSGVLDKGDSLLLFPEGTRNAGPELLKPFKRGAFKLSIETGKPIAVCTAVNSNELLPGDSWFIRPGKIHCYWDGPFYPDEYMPDRLEEFQEMIWAKMHERMLAHYPEGQF